MQLKLTLFLYIFILFCSFSGFSQSIEKKSPEKINYTLSLTDQNIENKFSFIEALKNEPGVISCNAIKESSVEIIYQADDDFSAVIKEKMLYYGLVADRFVTAKFTESNDIPKTEEKQPIITKTEKKIR